MDSALFTNHIATRAVNAIRVWNCSRGAYAGQSWSKGCTGRLQAAARCTNKKQEQQHTERVSSSSKAQHQNQESKQACGAHFAQQVPAGQL
jgi:hypothetical protein